MNTMNLRNRYNISPNAIERMLLGVAYADTHCETHLFEGKDSKGNPATLVILSAKFNDEQGKAHMPALMSMLRSHGEDSQLTLSFYTDLFEHFPVDGLQIADYVLRFENLTFGRINKVGQVVFPFNEVVRHTFDGKGFQITYTHDLGNVHGMESTASNVGKALPITYYMEDFESVEDAYYETSNPMQLVVDNTTPLQAVAG